MTQQQEPREIFTNIWTGFMPGSAYQVSTLDTMVLWGYSRTVARRRLREGHVFSSSYGLLVGDTFVVDFLEGDEDFCALIVQRKWGSRYWSKSTRALNLHARRLGIVETLRLWLVRHVYDREWLLPRAGAMEE